MSTPMFKVLAQSLRLGQPPDATTAVRVLVEVLEKQQTELEDLRSKLSIASSRLSYAEARLSRLLELVEGAELGEGAPPSARSAPPRAPEPARGSQRPPAGPGPAAIPQAPRVPTFPPPHPQARPAAPPAEARPTPQQKTVAAAMPDNTMDIPSIVDVGFDEFNQTLVINKRDVEQAARAEAPFPLAPASERPRPQTARGTPFQRVPAAPASTPTPPQASPQSEDESFVVNLPDDDGEGATVTDRIAREALEGLAELEAREARRRRGGQ